MKISSKIPYITTISQVLIIVGTVLYLIERFLLFSKIAHEFNLESLALTFYAVSLVIQIQLIYERLDAIQDSIQVLKESKHIKKTILEIREMLILSNKIHTLSEKALLQHPNKIHIVAAVDALREVVKMQHEENLDEIVKLDNGGNSAVLKDISSSFGMLNKLEENLPAGCVWFGITHLADPLLWQHAAGGFFAQYIADMHDKTSKKQLFTYRIFCFPDNESYKNMIPIMKIEAKANVLVKYVITSSPPTDLSIICHPKSNKFFELKDEDICGSHSLKSLARTMEYKPLCSLKFATKDWQLLQSVSISKPESPEFKELSGIFLDSWRDAELFSV